MTKKNGGNVPVCNDERQKYVWIPCKQCYICRKKKAREWRMRITEDIKVNQGAKIVTLTFNTESLKKLAKKCKGVEGYELDNQICKLAVKLFRERWRKKYGKSPRHWLITELGHGETEHVHMHGIIWPDSRYKLEDTLLNEVEKIWNYGWVGKGKRDYQTGGLINYVNAKTANYFTKYVNKIDEMHPEYKQIILTSAGIGKAYIESNKAIDNIYKGKETNQLYNVDNGGALPMPDYFRKKLYTDEEREKLTSYYLDRRITYIEGKEIRLDIGDAAIFRLIKTLREKNKRLGYGDGGKNWARKRFENAKRVKKHRERFLKEEDLKLLRRPETGLGGPESVNSSLRSLDAKEEWPEWVVSTSGGMLPNEKFYEQEDKEIYEKTRNIMIVKQIDNEEVNKVKEKIYHLDIEKDTGIERYTLKRKTATEARVSAWKIAKGKKYTIKEKLQL